VNKPRLTYDKLWHLCVENLNTPAFQVLSKFYGAKIVFTTTNVREGLPTTPIVTVHLNDKAILRLSKPDANSEISMREFTEQVITAIENHLAPEPATAVVTTKRKLNLNA